MTKRNRQRQKQEYVSKEMEIKQLLTIIGSIIAIFVLFMLITTYVVNKQTDTPIAATDIQFDNIIVGTILTRAEAKYYVLAVYDEDSDVGLYDTYHQIYKAKTGSLRMYTLDLGDTFNKKFVGATSNLKVTDISKIMFKQTTLLYIESGKIAKTYEGKTAIIAQLETLID